MHKPSHNARFDPLKHNPKLRDTLGLVNETASLQSGGPLYPYHEKQTDKLRQSFTNLSSTSNPKEDSDHKYST